MKGDMPINVMKTVSVQFFFLCLVCGLGMVFLGEIDRHRAKLFSAIGGAYNVQPSKN